MIIDKLNKKGQGRKGVKKGGDDQCTTNVDNSPVIPLAGLNLVLAVFSQRVIHFGSALVIWI